MFLSLCLSVCRLLPCLLLRRLLAVLALSEGEQLLSFHLDLRLQLKDLDLDLNLHPLVLVQGELVRVDAFVLGYRVADPAGRNHLGCSLYDLE